MISNVPRHELSKHKSGNKIKEVEKVFYKKLLHAHHKTLPISKHQKHKRKAICPILF